MESVFLQLFVLFLTGFVAGAIGGMSQTRALKARILDLEFRVEEQEGRLLHEVKSRAAQKARSVKESQDEMEKWALEQTSTTEKGHSATVPQLGNWIKRQMGQNR